MLAGGYSRIAARLALCAALTTVPFIALNEVRLGWWPLNMMATLLVAVVVAWHEPDGWRPTTLKSQESP